MQPLVADLMETEVVTVAVGTTLRTVGETLHERGIGSLIVSSEADVPVGIVTPDDVFRALAATEQPLAAIPVEEYASHPLETIERDAPVRRAVRAMNEADVEQLAIVEDYDVAGIVSRGDVLAAYEDLIAAAHEAERRSWS